MISLVCDIFCPFLSCRKWFIPLYCNFFYLTYLLMEHSSISAHEMRTHSPLNSRERERETCESKGEYGDMQRYNFRRRFRKFSYRFLSCFPFFLITPPFFFLSFSLSMLLGIIPQMPLPAITVWEDEGGSGVLRAEQELLACRFLIGI